MNKNSIFFKITLFFVVLIITTHLIIYLGYNITKQQQVDIYINHYMKALHRVTKKIMDENLPPDFMMQKDEMGGDSKEIFFKPPPPKPLFEDDMKGPFNPFDKIDEVKEGLKLYDLELSKIKYEKLKKVAKFISSDDEWELYEYNEYRYFYMHDKFRTVLIKDKIKNRQKSDYIIYLAILLNIVFISFYIFLIKKLQPLQKLKNNIVQFSKGNLDINTSCDGKDEISEVSNEFNNAISEIRQLTNSRNLFLRNIMHELKTPITKGLLVSGMMEDGKHKESLKRAFFRLEYLLNEFARIEEFTSKNLKLEKKEFRIIDIIDHSLDILLSNSEAIELEVKDNIVINVDFELFALAVKNLLDNAIKYGDEKPKVIIENQSVIIKNGGAKLLKPIDEYNTPFNKEYENSNSGLGLGLYIVNHIIKAHNLKLDYKYLEDTNIFTIKF